VNAHPRADRSTAAVASSARANSSITRCWLATAGTPGVRASSAPR